MIENGEIEKMTNKELAVALKATLDVIEGMKQLCTYVGMVNGDTVDEWADYPSVLKATIREHDTILKTIEKTISSNLELLK